MAVRRISAFLEKWVLSITYYYAYVLGLLPAPFNGKSQKFEYSRAYLVYSAFIQCAFLLVTPMGTPMLVSIEEGESIYMLGDIVLQWTYYAGKIARILTIIIMSLVTWLRRQNIMDLYESYLEFEKKYQQFCQHYSMEKEMRSEVHTIKWYTIYKFCTTHCQGLVISSLLLLMQHQPGGTFYLMVLINFLQTFFMLVSNIEFFVTLTRIHLRFVYINKSLETMVLQQCSPSLMINRCWTLYCMHFECYHLSRRILRISRSLTLCMLIKMFTTNVATLYHAVQFANGSIEADETDNMVGMLTIVFFYWDTFLVITAIDSILTSCNQTADILSNLSSLEVEAEAGTCQVVDFTKLLSQFHQYLACNKLTFYIFGLFPLNKATCLQYLLSALVHVIVLVQFDLKLRP